MMKHTLAAAGLSVAAAAAAHAQSTVTVYGLVDTGIEYLNNIGPTGSNLIRMPTLTGTLPSRWGLRGTEDLGSGVRAVFTLESGFGLDSGVLNQGGRLFGRQALVGLSGNWGSVTLGRQYTMMFWSILESDQLGPNVHGLGSQDSYLPNARTDNAIAYRGTFNGLTLGATYSFGRDTVNAGPSPAGTNCAGENAADKSACREWSAMVKYDTPTWGTALAVDEFRGGSGAFAGLTNSTMKDTRITANGYIKFDTLKLVAGVIRRDNDASITTPRSALWWIGASYNFTPAFTFDGQVSRLEYRNSSNESTLVALRGTYFLSKRTALYATAGHINNDGALANSVSAGAAGGNPVPGGAQTGVMFGMRHAF